MANVIAVVNDDRTRRQIEQFLQELGMDDLRFATFQSSEEFQALYFRDRSKDPPPPENPEPPKEGEEGAELKLFSEIHLFIFSLDAIGEKSAPWIDKLKLNLKKFKYWPEAGPPRFVMLKYEDDGLSKLDVMHPLLDDLIYQPIDRLVFLQKMQIFMTLPKKATPQFLFNQEVNHNIEISKISKVDRLSDVGLAIRNPVPLQKGLPGHFYLQLPGEKTRLELRAKVFKSEPHPEYPGLFLVYFTYFGVSKAALTQIRRALSKAPQYKSILKDDRGAFRYNPDSLFGEPGKERPFGAAIVDSDEIVVSALPQSLTKEMDRLNVIGETSYQMFLHKYLEKDKGDGTPPKTTEDADFYKVPVSLSVAADLKCLSIDPGPGEEDKFLGHNARQLFSTPDGWLSLLQDKHVQPLLEEAVQLAARGRVLEKMIVLKDAEGARRAVNFKIYRGSSEGATTIDLKPAGLNDIGARQTDANADFKLDFMIVDATFVPEDPASWMEGLRMRAAQVNMAEKPENLKFFFTADSEDKTNLNWLNSKDVLGLFIKPIDTRQLLFLLSEYLPNPYTLYQFNNVGWSQPSIPVHVSKNVDLEMLSEFGATLRTKQKLVPGTMIYLRKGIFDNAPNNCLAARVYMCEEHPKEKGYYQVSATYFGINDAFLKFARTWIRENYAQQKKEGG